MKCEQITQEGFLKEHGHLNPYKLYMFIEEQISIAHRNVSVLDSLMYEARRRMRNDYAVPAYLQLKDFCIKNNLCEKISFDDEKNTFCFTLFGIPIIGTIQTSILYNKAMIYRWSLKYNTNKGVSRASINKIHVLFDANLTAPRILRNKMPTSSREPANEEYVCSDFETSDELVDNIKRTIINLLK